MTPINYKWVKAYNLKVGDLLLYENDYKTWGPITSVKMLDGITVVSAVDTECTNNPLAEKRLQLKSTAPVKKVG